MIRIADIAHYGRWFPYEGGSLPLWWFDVRTEKTVPIEEVHEMCGYNDINDIDADMCKEDGIIPYFRLDIPKLEMEYAKEFLPWEVKRMMEMDTRSMDYDFGRVIEKYGLESHWYNYELQALSDLARQWCGKNHIPFKA